MGALPERRHAMWRSFGSLKFRRGNNTGVSLIAAATGAVGREHGGLVRGGLGGPRPPLPKEVGGGDVNGSTHFPPFPAAAVSGRDRRAVARRHRLPNPWDPKATTQYDGSPR